MNLSQLQYVTAVAETSSFSRAAEQCFVTQPSLSNAIAQLEFEFGSKIFSRTTRKVSLTPFGEKLLPRIQEVLDSIENLENEVKSYLNPPHKVIRFGFSPLLDIHLITTIFEPFKTEYPDVEFIFKECFLDDMQSRLEQHKIDIVFTSNGMNKKDLHSEFFYEEPLFFLPRENGNLKPAKTDSVILNNLESETFVVTPDGCGLFNNLREMFSEYELDFKEYKGKALSYTVLEDWVELGIGATILPLSKVSENNKNIQKILLEKNKPAKIKYEMLWNKNAAQSTHILDFIKFFKKTVPQRIKGMAVHQS